MSFDFRGAPKNAYWIVRHGQSEANVIDKIAGSSPANVDGNCLTEIGKEQVKKHFVAALDEYPRGQDRWLVYSSPLCRARETAEIIAGLVGVDVRIDGRLIERNFGNFEGEDTSRYNFVWARDTEDQSVAGYGIEELENIAERVTDLVEELESKYAKQNIVLCTHGDIASVLIAEFARKPLSLHRTFGALDTGAVYYLPEAADPQTK